MATRGGRRPRGLRPPHALAVAWAMVALSLVGCVHSASTASPGEPSARPPQGVTVASFDFPESEVLAEIYGQTLRAHGVAVDEELDLGARELVMPALIR